MVPAFIGSIGTTELVIILIIALLIFGSRLPKVMRSLGQSVNEFKRGVNEVVDVEDEPKTVKKSDTAEPKKDEEAAV